MNIAHPDPSEPGTAGHHTQPAVVIVPAGTAGTALPKRRHPLARVGAWVGWHGIELTTVAVPLAAALLWSRWLAVLAAASGTVWAVQEIRTARQHRAAADTEGEQP